MRCFRWRMARTTKNRPDSRHREKRMRGWAIAALLALGLVANGAASAQAPKPEKEALSLAVGGQGLIPYLPLTIAQRMGLFTRQGLAVEISDFAGGSKALQALV